MTLKRGRDKKARAKSIYRAKKRIWLDAWDKYTYIDDDLQLIIPEEVMIPFRDMQRYEWLHYLVHGKLV